MQSPLGFKWFSPMCFFRTLNKPQFPSRALQLQETSQLLRESRTTICGTFIHSQLTNLQPVGQNFRSTASLVSHFYSKRSRYTTIANSSVTGFIAKQKETFAQNANSAHSMKAINVPTLSLFYVGKG